MTYQIDVNTGASSITVEEAMAAMDSLGNWESTESVELTSQPSRLDLFLTAADLLARAGIIAALIAIAMRL